MDTGGKGSVIKHLTRKPWVCLQRGEGKKKEKKRKEEKKDWQKKRLDEVAGTAGGNLKSVYIRAGCS